MKGQKLLAQGNGYNQHALKGQKLLAQGIALGIVTVSNAPCKGKSFINFSVSFKAFALTGRQVCEQDNPGRCPGLRASALSGRAASMSFCPLPMLSAGDLWLRACRVISTVQVILFSVSYEIVLSLADKSIFRDTECTFQITEWRFRTTECTFRVTERNFL